MNRKIRTFPEGSKVFSAAFRPSFISEKSPQYPVSGVGEMLYRKRAMSIQQNARTFKR